MASDPSIYNLIQPQRQPDILGNVAGAMQVKGLMDQSALHELQRSQLEQGIAEESQIKDLFRQGKATPEALMGISPKTGMAYQKSALEADKTRAELDKTKTETRGLQVKQLRDQLASVTDDTGLGFLRDSTVKLFGPEAAAKMPTSVSDPNFAKWRADNLMTADTLLERLKPQYQMTNLGGTSQVTQINPNAPGAQVGPLAHTKTPGEIEQGRHNLETERRQKEANAVAARTALITQQEHKGKLDTAERTRQGAIASYGRAIETLDRIATHEGFSDLFGGAVIPGKRFIPGTDASNLDAELDAFKAQAFLPMVEQLKGMGALSENEGKKLTDAVGALNRGMSESAAQASIKRIKTDLKAAMDRHTAQGRSTPGVDVSKMSDDEIRRELGLGK